MDDELILVFAFCAVVTVIIAVVFGVLQALAL